jgi:hypothetical protein
MPVERSWFIDSLKLKSRPKGNARWTFGQRKREG